MPWAANLQDRFGGVASSVRFQSFSRGAQYPKIVDQATRWYSSKDAVDTVSVPDRRDPFNVAEIGSTTTSDTNDPTFFDHDGTHYVWFPPDTSNFARIIPATNAAGAATVYTWRVRVDNDSDNHGSNAQSVGPSSARFYVGTKADVATITTTNDSTGGAQVNSVSLAGVDTAKWVDFDLDVTNDQVRARMSNTDTVDPDAVVWESYTAWEATAAAVRPMQGTQGATLVYGASTGTASVRVYKAFFLEDGVVNDEFTFDPASDIDTTSDPDAGQSSWVNSGGETWTVTRHTSGLKTAVVTRPVLLVDGTDDYVQLPAADTPSFTATSGKHTAVVLLRTHSVNLNSPLLNWQSSATDGLDFYMSSAGTPTAVLWGDSGTPVSATAVLSTSEIAVTGFVVDDGSLTVYDDTNGFDASPADITGAGTWTSAIGRVFSKAYSTAATHEDELFDTLLFDGVALTEAQLDDVSTYLKTGSGADGLKIIQDNASAYYKAGQAIDTATITSAVRDGSASAQIGSTATSDTNDPTFLDHDGEHYMRIFTGANNARTPNPSAGATGDLTVVARFSKDAALDGQYPIGMYNGGSSGRWGSYWGSTSIGVYGLDNSSTAFNLTAAYALFTNVSFDGTGEYWYKLTRVSGVWTAWLEPGGSSTEPTFTTPVLLSSGVSDGGDVLNTTPNIDFGSAAGTAPGVYYYCRIEQAAGTVTFDPANDIDTTSDPDAGQASWTASTGETWTISRASSGLKTAIVTRPVLLCDGTDDYVQLPTADTPTVTATAGKHTVVLCLRRQGATWPGWVRPFSTESADGDGLYFYGTSGGATVTAAISGDGPGATRSLGDLEDGQMGVLAAVVDDGTLAGYRDTTGLTATTSTTAVGTITHTNGLVGARGDFALYAGIEVFDVLLFDGVALTEAQLNDLSGYLLSLHT